MRSFSAQNKYGSYTLSYCNQIIYSTIVGSISDSLATKFNHHFAALLDVIPEGNYGFLGDLSGCQAYTGEAEKRLPESLVRGVAAGCIVDAYCVGTALSIAQLKRVRSEGGIKTPLDEHIFETIQDAENFIHLTLANYLQR